MVETRIRDGRLHRLYRGVYAVGHTALAEDSRLLAAVMACGPGAALSHRSAARLWKLTKRTSAIDVTCARARPPDSGIVVHRQLLLREERGFIDAIPVKSLAKTLVDCADALTQPQLEDVINESEVNRSFDRWAVDAAQARAPGRRGRHRLNRAMFLHRPRPYTRSDMERDFLAACEMHGVDSPLVNLWVECAEVDFHWPAARLIVEVDGGETHRTRRAFEEDRRRDRTLTLLGWRVMRFTWLDVELRAAGVAAQVAQALTR